MMNFRNKSGFSLLEIIIAMGLATGLLVFLMKMQGESAKNAKTAAVNQAVETFFTDFKATIDRPGFCDKSFENISLSDNSAQTIQAIKNPRGDVRYAVGETYGTNSLKLNGITLKDFKPDDKDGLEGIATLELTLERLGKIYGGKLVKKTMEVSVSRDKSRKILSCGALGTGGGMNINIEVPKTNPGTTPATAPNTNPNSSSNTNSNSNSNSNASSGTVAPATLPSSSGTGTSGSPEDDARTQAAMLKELQNSPQMKQMQEAIKSMQKQGADGADVE